MDIDAIKINIISNMYIRKCLTVVEGSYHNTIIPDK